MACIMRGIMDGLNMRKADKTDDEKTAEHRQKRLDCAGRFNRYRLRGDVVLDRHGEPSRSMHTQSQNGTGSVCNGHADPQSTSVTTGKHTKKEETAEAFPQNRANSGHPAGMDTLAMAGLLAHGGKSAGSDRSRSWRLPARAVAVP